MSIEWQKTTSAYHNWKPRVFSRGWWVMSAPCPSIAWPRKQGPEWHGLRKVNAAISSRWDRVGRRATMFAKYVGEMSRGQNWTKLGLLAVKRRQCGKCARRQKQDKVKLRKHSSRHSSQGAHGSHAHGPWRCLSQGFGGGVGVESQQRALTL